MAETQDYHIRLPVELVQRIDHLRIERRMTRQALVERLLDRGLAVVTGMYAVQDHDCGENDEHRA